MKLGMESEGATKELMEGTDKKFSKETENELRRNCE